jgi:protein SCO1
VTVGSSAVEHESALEALVAAIRSEPHRREELVPLLREDAGVYRGVGAATATRIRGWILAAFAEVGLPPEAVPFVVEDLTTAVEPYLLGAAARASRGAQSPELAAALITALERAHSRDDTITFEALRPTWPPRRPTTVTAEVLEALRRLGPAAAHALPELRALQARDADRWSARRRRAVAAAIAHIEALPPARDHCCTQDSTAESSADSPGGVVDVALALEDQDGCPLTLGELLAQPLTVVAFFYTRCPNPDRCSTTITNLARLQALLATGTAEDTAIGVAAITYDPGYDTPSRLRTYGSARGLHFGPTVRMARCPRQHDALVQSFGLRVGYNSSIVNRHAIELYLVAADGRILKTWSRRHWNPGEIAAAARRLCADDNRVTSASAANGGG